MMCLDIWKIGPMSCQGHYAKTGLLVFGMPVDAVI